MSRALDFWGSAIMSRLESVRHGHSKGVSLGFLDRSGCILLGDVRAALSRLFPSLSAQEIDATLGEALAIVTRASEDSGSSQAPASVRWNIGELTGLLLASAVIVGRPKVVVEVGVANGTSTRILLAGLARNGAGRLHSFDIDERCSHVVSPDLAENWDFTLLPQGRAQASEQLASSVRRLDQIDLWFSDADHTFAWQKWEWQLALNSLAPSGVLIADDIDATPAWVKILGGIGAVALIDGRKVTGALQPQRELGKSD